MSRARIALTQSPGSLDDLQALLEAQGFDVLRTPLVETRPRTDERTRERTAILASLPWVLVTSRSTVEALTALDVDVASLRLGAVGPGTAAALEAAGGTVTLTGVPATAEGLARSFIGHPDAAGPVGLPRGNRALDTLERELGEAGFATVPLVVYDTVTREWEPAEVDAVVLASPSAVAALPDEVAQRGRLVALGPTTAHAARSRGWNCEEAVRPTAEDALAALERVLG